MCLTKLSIKNFKGIVSLDSDLQSVNCLVGENGKGKTSTIEALKWALIGSFNTAFVRKDNTNPSVEVTFKDGTTIYREYDGDKQVVKVNGKASGIKEATALVLEHELHCSLEVADAMFDTKAMERYANNPKAFSEFLLSFLPVRIKKDTMYKFMVKFLKRDLTDAEKTFFDSKISSDEITLNDMDGYYKQFYDDRRVANKEVKDLAPKAAFDEKLMPTETKEALTERLGVISAQEKGMVDYSKNVLLYEKSVAANKTATDRKLALETELKSYEGLKLPAENMEAIREAKKNLMIQLRQSDKELSDSDAILKTYKVAYNGFSNGGCPYMPDGKCPLDHKAIMASMVEKGKVQRAVSDAAAERSQAIREQIDALDKQMEEFSRISNLLTKKEAIQTELSALVIPEILPKPEKVESIDFSTEKAELSRKLSLIEQSEMAKKFKGLYESASANAKLLDTAVKIFDPKGIKREILKQTMGPVEKIINKNSARFNNRFTVSIVPSDDGEFTPIVSTKGVNVPIDQLSSGEFILVCFLIMEAIREITGVKILVIDNLDKLDAKNAETFLQLIKSGTGYENVFLAGVDHEVIRREAVNVI